jgi:hypothetical protein
MEQLSHAFLVALSFNADEDLTPNSYPPCRVPCVQSSCREAPAPFGALRNELLIRKLAAARAIQIRKIPAHPIPGQARREHAAFNPQKFTGRRPLIS